MAVDSANSGEGKCDQSRHHVHKLFAENGFVATITRPFAPVPVNIQAIGKKFRIAGGRNQRARPRRRQDFIKPRIEGANEISVPAVFTRHHCQDENVIFPI